MELPFLIQHNYDINESTHKNCTFSRNTPLCYAATGGYYSEDEYIPLVDNVYNQSFLSHGVNHRDDGSVVVYVNLPIPLSGGSRINFNTQDVGLNKVTVEYSTSEVDIEKLTRPFLLRYSVDNTAVDLQKPNIIMQGNAELVKQVVYSAFGLTKEHPEFGDKMELWWPMPSMESEYYIKRKNMASGVDILYAISGVESTVPGGGYHFIKVGQQKGENENRDIETLGGSNLFGGAVWYLKENKDKDPSALYYHEKVALVLNPRISSGENDRVEVFTPMVPSFDPEMLKLFRSRSEVLNIFYVNPDEFSHVYIQEAIES